MLSPCPPINPSLESVCRFFHLFLTDDFFVNLTPVSGAIFS